MDTRPSAPYTVLVVRSDRFNEAGLWAALQQLPYLTLVEAAPWAGPTAQTARTHRPHVVIVTADMTGTATVALVRGVREASPSSKLMVVSEARALDRATLQTLTALKTAAYVLWEDLAGARLPLCLAVLLHTDLLIGSRAALDELLALPERRRYPRDPTVVLIPLERAALQGLIHGFTQREIAEAQHVSEPTIRRLVSMLRARFGVTTPCALCAEAVRLGLVA